MAVATARTIALQGATGHLIDVQVDVSQGVVKTAMVGRADASISEARDRCRTAVNNSGFDWPATRRVTILLSPADLPKRGPTSTSRSRWPPGRLGHDHRSPRWPGSSSSAS